MEKFFLEKILEEGAWITSSGTTGTPKNIFRDPKNIKTCNEVARRAQKIDSSSSIYTVTRLTHAGGLLAQTLPAISAGANVKIDNFNPFTFLHEFLNHTHTFLPPEYMDAISKTKNFQNYDFKKKLILTGSSPVPLDLIQKFIERNAIVQPNWGMSEVGPITIYSTIDSLEALEDIRRKCPPNTFLMGDHFEINYKVKNKQLWVLGDLCVYENWFATGDFVEVVENTMFFQGRKPQ